MIAQQSVA